MTYDYCEQYGGQTRSKLMLKAVLLTDSQVKKYGRLMTDISKTDASPFDDSFSEDASKLAATSADTFSTDNYGFSATVSREHRSLVFFSVPYDEGWTATVNGEKAEIEKVNVGFMAVAVPAGISEIRFNYTTPGLDTGIYVTLVSLIVFLIYFIICSIYNRRHPADTVYPEGERLIEKWLNENLSAADSADELFEPSLLDKLEDSSPQIPKEKNTGGFSINTDLFD